MKSLLEIFPRASKSTVAANPHLSASATVTPKTPKNPVQAILKRGLGLMNKTETEFSLILEDQKRKGEILRAEYEGITLRWADMRYTPDFVVFVQPLHTPQPKRLVLIEVKGGHIWDRDIVRFKGARAYWPEFAFEMHQKTKQGWKRIH